MPILVRVKVGRDRPQLCAGESSLLFVGWKTLPTGRTTFPVPAPFCPGLTAGWRTQLRAAATPVEAHMVIFVSNRWGCGRPSYGRGLPRQNGRSRVLRWRRAIMCRPLRMKVDRDRPQNCAGESSAACGRLMGCLPTAAGVAKSSGLRRSAPAWVPLGG
jgi:hypothetical protein